MPEKVALASCREYGPDLKACVFAALEAADLHLASGLRVLVKPNLLTSSRLACTNPDFVAAACEWLLDQGTKITIADSPAFGSAAKVAEAVGLAYALKPFGLQVREFGHPQKIRLDLPGQELKPAIKIAKEALEADLILSLPRVKAHSQMRLSLAVKNCYGVICGLRKAIAHARFGASVDLFADCVAALWAALPPVAALCDGIVAMSGTGPIKGVPCQLGLIAASASAPACDAAIMAVLKQPVDSIPLALALLRRGVDFSNPAFTLQMPEEFSPMGFQTPETLREISFNPLYLGKTLLKRVWLKYKH